MYEILNILGQIVVALFLGAFIFGVYEVIRIMFTSEPPRPWYADEIDTFKIRHDLGKG